VSEDTKYSIGGKLKSRREELGHTLKDAADRTRIRKSYIESLEADRFSSLPGEAYVTGFIKVYAGYLGLDPIPLLAMLEDKPAETASEPSVQETSQPIQNLSADNKQSTGWAAFFIGFIVVLFMGGGLYFMLTGNDEKPLPVETPAVEKHETLKEEKPEPVKEAPPVAEAGQPEVTEEAEPAVVTDAEKVSAEPEKALAIIKKTGSSLRMLAVSDGSLIINVDQRKPQEYVLHDGLDLTWKVKEKVFFEMAEAGQARFWLDGVEIKLGDRESLQISHAP
jgi:cytoskeleton protein RodZ